MNVEIVASSTADAEAAAAAAAAAYWRWLAKIENKRVCRRRRSSIN